ncbi:MAG: hypothetical protein AAF250_00605 [Pseudomonadota bacterium]
MAVKLWMPSAFDRHTRIGEIIGRMVIEYGEMEWDLCLLVSHVSGDDDTAFKAIYRSRGETQRINVADALVRHKLTEGKFRTIYEQTIANIRRCLKLRNQYAHTNWLDTPSDGLCFVDVEELAKSDQVFEISNAKRYQLDLETVSDQQRFFIEVLQNLRYLCMEYQYLNGSSSHQGFHYVENVKPPLAATEISVGQI